MPWPCRIPVQVSSPLHPPWKRRRIMRFPFPVLLRRVCGWVETPGPRAQGQGSGRSKLPHHPALFVPANQSERARQPGPLGPCSGFPPGPLHVTWCPSKYMVCRDKSGSHGFSIHMYSVKIILNSRGKGVSLGAPVGFLVITVALKKPTLTTINRLQTMYNDGLPVRDTRPH